MTPPAATATPVATPYAFPVRALRRWTGENLTLTPRPDGGVEAVFRLEGSTCANIAFFLLYCVTLAPAAAGHRIETMNCAPAPYDEGYTRMCGWQENAEAMAATMRDEAPLLGRPLDSVLAWRPEKAPPGCLCAQPSRHYKWLAVLETLHFALHQSPASSLS